MDQIMEILSGLIETITGMVGGEGFDIQSIISTITETLGGLMG